MATTSRKNAEADQGGYDRAVESARGSASASPYFGSQGADNSGQGRASSWVARYRPRPSTYRKHWRSRLGAWLIGLNHEVMRSSTWMGVPAAKNPLDAWIYQEIVSDTQPEAIVELGSAFGGGTLFLAHLLDLIASDGIVVSVDISREAYKAQHHRIIEVTGSTAAPDVIERVRELTAGKRTM